MDTFALTAPTTTARRYGPRPGTMTGANNPSWKGGKVRHSCAECGKPVVRFPSLAKSAVVFCSRACKDAHGLISIVCAWPGCTMEMPARTFVHNRHGVVYKTELTKRGDYSKSPICAHHRQRLLDNYGTVHGRALNSFWKFLQEGHEPRVGRGITRKLAFIVWERQDGKCAACENTFKFNARRPRSKEDDWTGTWECDHVVPVFEGGKTTLENLQALCHECHDVKSRVEKSRAATNRHSRTSGAYRTTNYEKNAKIEELCNEVAELRKLVLLLVMNSKQGNKCRV